MRPRLLVFDWDLTLWDSWTVHREALRHALQAVGHPEPPEEEVVRYFLAPMLRSLNGLVGPDGRTAEEAYLEFYNAHWERLSGPFPGVRDLLERLREAGYRLALLSNKPRPYGPAEVERAGLTHLFEALVFGNDLPTAKPDPAGLRAILERTGTPPRDALLVGDHPTDVECARRAGVLPVGALWACLDPEGLLRAGPARVWHTLQEAEQDLLSP